MLPSTHEAAAVLGVAAWEIHEVRCGDDGRAQALVYHSADHTSTWRSFGPVLEDDGADLDGDGVPDGSAAAVLAWVDGDPDRAADALSAEQGRDKPRTTLIAALEKLAG